MLLLRLTYTPQLSKAAAKPLPKEAAESHSPADSVEVTPEDGPGAGGGYNEGDEVAPEEGPGAGGGYNEGDEVLPEDGPGAGGGYNEGDEVLPEDGPGAGGGYNEGDEEDGPGAGGGYNEGDEVLPYDGPGAGGGYTTFSHSSTDNRWDSPVAIFSTFDPSTIPSPSSNRGLWRIANRNSAPKGAKK